jgi:hypothetical protein
MSAEAVNNNINLVLKKEIIDFEERPSCPACKISMSIYSHSSPSIVTGFEGQYYTEYVEYTCTNKNCHQYKKKKHRAPNPWRIDRHKYDLEVETWVIRQRFREKCTYLEIKSKLERDYGLEITQKTIGNIIYRYEVSRELESQENNPPEFKKNGGIFIEVDTIFPFKGEDKHIVAMDHYTKRTVLVQRVKSENTVEHAEFQRKLKKYTRQNKIKVLGFMSDDHVSQRKAIFIIWGSRMKHCRCHFHFKLRILEKAFELNRRLKTKAKAKIRKIIHVKNFREGKLKTIENSEIWGYIEEIIKDLIAMQNWKNKRNDTNLESIKFYERLQDIYKLLEALKEKISLTHETEYIVEKKRLNLLIENLEDILNEFNPLYKDLLSIKGHQDTIREILEAHEESSEIGLGKLVDFTETLEKKLQSGLNICEEEKFLIEKLCSFVYDRGESLFNYRDIDGACNTNNNQENKFKSVKQNIRRTQGNVSSARYFQTHGKYMMYVDPNASIEEIKKTLMNADYKEITRIMKEERELRKRPLSKIKNDEKWNSRKKILKEKLQNIK